MDKNDLRTEHAYVILKRMKGGKQPQGFTIVEVMIFLAISSVMFVAAINLLGGKQAKTAFSTSIAQLTSQLQSVIGNVANGYYINGQNFTCTPGSSSGSRPIIALATGTSSRGTNLGCIFVGEVVQFYKNTSTNIQDYVVYPTVGNQYIEPVLSTPVAATSLQQSPPLALYPYGKSSVDESQTTQLPYGITVDSAVWIDNGQSNSTGAASIGFFTTFNGSGGGMYGLGSGSQSVQVVPIPGSFLNESQAAAVQRVDSLSEDSSGNITVSGSSSTSTSDPNGGIKICFDSGTDNESGLITIGGLNSPTSVSLVHFSKKGCTNA